MNVDQAAYDAFRAAVFDRHNKLRGSLQDEASAALLAYIPTLRRSP